MPCLFIYLVSRKYNVPAFLFFLLKIRKVHGLCCFYEFISKYVGHFIFLIRLKHSLQNSTILLCLAKSLKLLKSKILCWYVYLIFSLKNRVTRPTREKSREEDSTTDFFGIFIALSLPHPQSLGSQSFFFIWRDSINDSSILFFLLLP